MSDDDLREVCLRGLGWTVKVEERAETIAYPRFRLVGPEGAYGEYFYDKRSALNCAGDVLGTDDEAAGWQRDMLLKMAAKIYVTEEDQYRCLVLQWSGDSPESFARAVCEDFAAWSERQEVANQ